MDRDLLFQDEAGQKTTEPTEFSTRERWGGRGREPEPLRNLEDSRTGRVDQDEREDQKDFEDRGLKEQRVQTGFGC